VISKPDGPASPGRGLGGAQVEGRWDRGGGLARLREAAGLDQSHPYVPQMYITEPMGAALCSPDNHRAWRSLVELEDAPGSCK